MAPIEIALFTALGLLVLFHVYAATFASWHVSKSTYFEPGQKYAQYAIIWLLPIIGVAIVLQVLSPDVRPRSPGWVPWFEFLLVAAFVSSASAATENSATEFVANLADSSSAGGGDD